MPSLVTTGTNAVRLIQLSDPHLGAHGDYRLAGVRTADTFNGVLQDILKDSAQQPIDGLVVSGDISARGDEGSYQLFEKCMAKAPFPFYWLPGNHDDIEVMQSALTTPFQFEVTVGNWLLLMLSSNQSGQVGGAVSEPELLRACTAALKHDGPVAVFVHHPPVPVGCAWIDEQRIDNGDALLERLAACGNVKALFTGHVHQAYQANVHDIAIYTTPSTCFQFAANSDNFAIGEDAPGYRWIDLHADGSVQTGVVHVASLAQSLDRNCIGY